MTNGWVKERNDKGFTIVELLIVIVVIAILAVVTIIAYNGIANRAKASAAQSATSQASKALLSYAVLNSDQYPPTLADANIFDKDTTSYQYTVDNSSATKSFCVTATNQDVSYYSSNTTANPQLGACAGHGVNGVPPITNLLPNPSIETGTANLANIGTATGRTITPTVVGDAVSGTTVLRVNQPTAGVNMGGYGSQTIANVPIGTYVATLWVRSNQTVTINPYLEGSSTRTTTSTSGGGSIPANTWRRLQFNFTVTVAGTVKVGYLSGINSPIANTYVDMDALMLTAGTTLYNYADGATANWAWSGTAHNSPSSGPPL